MAFNKKSKTEEQKAIFILQTTWCFSWDSQKFNSVLPILQDMKTSRATQIYFNSLMDVNPVKTISHVQFTELQSLDLAYNRISSFEHLSFLHAPLLNQLRLQSNYHTNLRGLRKCQFPKLRMIRLQDNPLNNLQFSQCHFPSLQELSIGVQIGYNSLVKLSSERMCYIRIENSSIPSRLMSVMQAKTTNLEIFVSKDHSSPLSAQSQPTAIEAPIFQNE